MFRFWPQAGVATIVAGSAVDIVVAATRRSGAGTGGLTRPQPHLLALSMIAQGHGHIMTISSVVGKLAASLCSSYFGAVHGIIVALVCQRAEI